MTKVVELKEAPANGRKAVLLFYAPWHDSTTIMTGVLDALASSTTDNDDTMLFAKVHAEEAPDLSKKYQVTSVPTFVLLQTDGSVVNKIEGANQVAALTQAVQKLTQAASVEEAKTSTADTEAQLKARLDGLIRSAPVMLFMKGNPSAPRCGFSRQAVALFEAEEIPFGSFDILSDETVRQGLKKHSDWPTYPQVYVHGELVGGLDILKEMAEESSLVNALGLTDKDMAKAQVAAPMSLNDRLKGLINQNKVMLFMKGLPSGPKCGFSRKIVDILENEGCSYGSFDILTDEEVRQGLKTYSDWPTYPQLYVGGELLGGLDIVQEMHEDGSLKEALGA